MKKLQIIFMALVMGSMFSLSSCLKKDFDAPPDVSGVDPALPVNMTIDSLKIKMASPGAPQRIDSNWTIYGIVTADDRSGNFYKQIVIQDSTGGIMINLNDNSLYSRFPIGRKVYVNLKGLYFGYYAKLPQLGMIDNGSLGDIPAASIDSFIVRANFPNEVVADTVSLTQLTNPNSYYLNRLVTIKDVEFVDGELGKTYSDNPNTANQSAADRYVHACTGAGTLDVRTSNYANFQSYKLPTGKGTLTGIYTVYNNSPQLVIRDTSDVKFYGLRCDGSTGNFLFNENFETVTNNSVITLDGWGNIPVVGTVKYNGGSFGGTKFAKVSAFGASQANVESWLITRAISLAGVNAPSLTFQTIDGYNNGATLEAYVSTNYDGNGNVSGATWTKLPAIISSGHTSGYGAEWISSGALDLTPYAGGNVYIGFKYVGSTSKTTTYELDNVKVTGQ